MCVGKENESIPKGPHDSSKTNEQTIWPCSFCKRRTPACIGLHALDFIKECRTELTKIHWKRRRGKKRDQVEALQTLVNLLRDWIPERGLSKTYPDLIRVKQAVTTEYGVRYYTIINEEGAELKLKTNRWIDPEDVWFMISKNERFPIDPILLKKFW